MSLGMQAQKLTTTTPVFDCGQVLFRQPVTTKFILKNKGSHQVVIKDVKTSCGCTTAVASKQKVAGGKEMYVNATYDAKQLGHFQKEIWIYEDGQKKPLELILKGVVVTEIKDYSGTYPFTLGQIRCDQNELEFDDANQGSMPMKKIHILNTTGETIEPVVMHLPDYLQAEISPTRLAPDQPGEISFLLLTNKIRNHGLSQTSVYLGKYAGDKVSAEKEIAVSAIVLPAFANNTTASMVNAPKIMLSATSLKKSEMTGKPEKLKGEIIVQNIGKSLLDISSLQMFTAGLQVSLAKTKLNPGETTKLKIQANELELKQIKQRPRILMITNDPSQPKVVIEIKD